MLFYHLYSDLLEMKETSKFLKLFFLSIIVVLAGCSDDEEEINLAPQAADQAFTLAKDSPSGTVVGTVIAADEEQDPLTFSITSGNTDNAFAINATTGQITVNTSTALEAETDNTLVLVVTISDGQNEVTPTITINLTDLRPMVVDQTFSVDENSESGSVVGIVIATDPNQATLNFSITGGNTGSAFMINASTGEITVQTSSVLDFEVTPSFTLNINVGNGTREASATVTITLNDVSPEPFTTRQQIIDALSESYSSLESYIEFVYLFDAVYANTIPAPDASWNDIFAHSQDFNNDKVEQFWVDGFELVFVLNNIISSSEAVLLAGQERNEIIAQALAIRAYLQFELVSWFGVIPLETEIVTDDLPFSQPNDVLTLVKTDLDLAISNLPATWTGDDMRNFTKGTAQALLLRVYTFNQQWTEAVSLSQELINNSLYSLSPTTNNFTATDSEITWGFDQTGEPVFAGAYDRGDHVPLARLTEAYLVNAEANIFLGQSLPAVNALNALKDRAGDPSIGTGVNESELLELTLAQWEAEMDLGGVSFATLRRFGIATTRFTIPDTRLVLPIPWDITENNPNSTQNPGY